MNRQDFIVFWKFIAVFFTAFTLLLFSETDAVVADAPLNQPDLIQVQAEPQSTPAPPSSSPRAEPTPTDHPPDPECADADSNCDCDVEDPVVLHSGEFMLQPVDMTIPGRGLAFTFRRTYRSHSVANGPLGYNWDYNYNQRIVPEPPNLIFHNGNARELTFTPQGDGAYTVARLGYYYLLTEKPDGTFSLRTRFGIESQYNALDGSPTAGRLNRIEDANGNAQRFHYDPAGRLIQVSDTLGRPIDFTYDGQERLVKVQDFTGRQLLFEYDDLGDLIATTQSALGWPASKTRITRYAYLSGYGSPQTQLNHNLVRVARPGYTLVEPDQIITYGTDAGNTATFDRALMDERDPDPAGAYRTTTYDYRAVAPGLIRVTITDGVGNVDDYEVTTAGGLTRQIEYANGSQDLAQARITTFTVNAYGERTSIAYPEGSQIMFVYDKDNPDPQARGNLLQEVEIPADGGQPLTTTYTYDPVFNHITGMTDPVGNRITYAYDENGNLAAITDPLGHTTTYQYDPFGTLINLTDSMGNVASVGEMFQPHPVPEQIRIYLPLVYKDFSNQLRQLVYLPSIATAGVKGKSNLAPSRITTEPVSLKSTRSADKNSGITYTRTVTEINALGNATVSEYDAYNNLIRVIDANGHISTFEYDPFDQLLQKTDALGNISTYTYDVRGNQTTTTDPNGHTTLYAYDRANRLTTITDPLGNKSVTLYDIKGRRVAETNANGQTTTYEYDEYDQLVLIRDALGGETRYAYDGNGNRIAETDANGHTTTYTYDDFNRLTQITDPLGNITRHEYDESLPVAGLNCGGGGMSNSISLPTLDCVRSTRGTNDRVMTVDANGKTTYFKYDPMDRLVQEVKKVGDAHPTPDADDAVTTYTYDALGNQLAVTKPNGTFTTFAYDVVSRLISVTNGAGESTRFAYDPIGNVIQTTAPNGNITVNTYDAANRLVQVDDNLGRLVSYTYDPASNQLTKTDGNGATMHATYDALNRLVATVDAMGETAAATYDAAGNILQNTDRNGNATVQLYDALNRRVVITDAMGFATNLVYDPAGNLVTITDANSHATRYAYDGLNRVITETYADGGARTFIYDGMGNQLSRTDQSGDTIRYEYNDLYFLTARDYPTGPDDAFTYDQSGRMLRADRGGWQVTFAYDGANRVVETMQDSQTVQYHYDVANHLRVITYPNGKVVTETTDVRSLLTQIDDGGSQPLVSYTHDQGNRILSRTYANGLATTRTYNDNDWLTALEHRQGGTLVAGFRYDYDREGKKRFEENVGQSTFSEAFVYDDVYRLVDFQRGELDAGAIPSPSTQMAWNLDPVHNWNSYTTDGIVENRTHNGVNAVVDIDAVTNTHDAKGNLVDNGQITYEYDYENRLSRVIRQSDGQIIGEYQYDALNRRVRKTAHLPVVHETRFFYDGNRVIEEQDGGNTTVATYVFGAWIDDVLQMERGGEAYYYLHNQQASVIGLTDSTGAVVERYHYSPYGCVIITDADGNLTANNSWGTPHSLTRNPYQYTGRRLDEESGLLFFRARYYHCDRGRFLQRDPVGYVNGMNLYASYFAVNGTDPTGEDGGITIAVVGICVGAACTYYGTGCDVGSTRVGSQTIRCIKSVIRNCWGRIIDFEWGRQMQNRNEICERNWVGRGTWYPQPGSDWQDVGGCV